MKEIQHKKNYFKNNFYRIKIEPIGHSQCDYLNESDIVKLDESNDCNHVFKFKINPKFFAFFIKSDQAFDDHVVVDIDDYVMTVMQLTEQGDKLNQCRENFPGFAHSFAIPQSIKPDEIKLYAKGNILIIIIPRL